MDVGRSSLRGIRGVSVVVVVDLEVEQSPEVVPASVGDGRAEFLRLGSEQREVRGNPGVVFGVDDFCDDGSVLYGVHYHELEFREFRSHGFEDFRKGSVLASFERRIGGILLDYQVHFLELEEFGVDCHW